MLAPGGAGVRASEPGVACTSPHLSRGAALQAQMNCMPGKSQPLGTCPRAEVAFPVTCREQGGILQGAALLPQIPVPTRNQPLSPPTPSRFPHPTLVSPDYPINPETELLSRAYPVG